jgi:hypothetical protein
MYADSLNCTSNCCTLQEDPNTGENMFESDSIIEHLFKKYGPGKQYIPWILKGRLSVAGCGSASGIILHTLI